MISLLINFNLHFNTFILIYVLSLWLSRVVFKCLWRCFKSSTIFSFSSLVNSNFNLCSFNLFLFFNFWFMPTEGMPHRIMLPQLWYPRGIEDYNTYTSFMQLIMRKEQTIVSHICTKMTTTVALRVGIYLSLFQAIFSTLLLLVPLCLNDIAGPIQIPYRRRSVNKKSFTSVD